MKKKVRFNLDSENKIDTENIYKFFDEKIENIITQSKKRYPDENILNIYDDIISQIKKEIRTNKEICLSNPQLSPKEDKEYRTKLIELLAMYESTRIQKDLKSIELFIMGNKNLQIEILNQLIQDINSNPELKQNISKDMADNKINIEEFPYLKYWLLPVFCRYADDESIYNQIITIFPMKPKCKNISPYKPFHMGLWIMLSAFLRQNQEAKATELLKLVKKEGLVKEQGEIYSDSYGEAMEQMYVKNNKDIMKLLANNPNFSKELLPEINNPLRKKIENYKDAPSDNSQNKQTKIEESKEENEANKPKTEETKSEKYSNLDIMPIPDKLSSEAEPNNVISVDNGTEGALPSSDQDCEVILKNLFNTEWQLIFHKIISGTVLSLTESKMYEKATQQKEISHSYTQKFEGHLDKFSKAISGGYIEDRHYQQY